MNEAMEYYQAKQVALIRYWSSVIIAMIGLISLYTTIPLAAEYGGYLFYGTAFVGGAMAVLGIIGVGIHQATTAEGYCRLFFSKIGLSADHPPLDDWHDDLKERDAFEVKYESE